MSVYLKDSPFFWYQNQSDSVSDSGDTVNRQELFGLFFILIHMDDGNVCCHILFFFSFNESFQHLYL